MFGVETGLVLLCFLKNYEVLMSDFEKIVFFEYLDRLSGSLHD